MTISKELLDELLKGCKRPEDLLGDPQLRERWTKCSGMVCRPQPFRHNVRGSLQCVTVSKTRMGQPRYTKFMTLPNQRVLWQARDRVYSGQIGQPKVAGPLHHI